MCKISDSNLILTGTLLRYCLCYFDVVALEIRIILTLVDVSPGINENFPFLFVCSLVRYVFTVKVLLYSYKLDTFNWIHGPYLASFMTRSCCKGH
jgi:hypothetical protein